jgi:inosose dehydratase
MPHSRREFLRDMAIGAAACALPSRATAFALRAHVPARMKFGYAAITWGGDDATAIDEIAELGFPGIQLRTSVLKSFGDNPRALSDLLARKKLSFVALSSGSVKIDPVLEAAAIAEHVSHARFLRDAGGSFLQITDDGSSGRPVTLDDCMKLGHVLTEIGRRTADVGIPVAYHPHMGTIGEKPGDAERILDASNPRYVKLLLDVAHYAQGGGDPAAAIRKHHDRLAFLHLKDVESVTPTGVATRPLAYRFVELGRGRVDLGAVFRALRDVKFDGWAVVELDSVAGLGHSPAEAAAISKRYLESKGFSVP